MKFEQLLILLKKHKIKINVKNDKLLVSSGSGHSMPAEILEGIKNHKQSLLNWFKSRRRLTPSDFPNARLTVEELNKIEEGYKDIQRLYLTTPMQQGMLFHGLYDGAGSSYLTQKNFELQGNLNCNAFKRAWQWVINRHDIFRTCFVGFENEHIHQLVKTDVEVPLLIEDWQNHSIYKNNMEQALVQYQQRDKERGFDFTKAPLMRLHLIQLEQQRYYFLWSHHHVLLDGWCVPVIFNEVMSCYTCLVNSNLKRYPEVPEVLPFEHYIQWLSQQNIQQARDFWWAQLQGINAATELHLGSAPEDLLNLEDKEEDTIMLQMAVEKSLQLDALAKSSQVTLNTLVQVAWGYLLHKYSGASKILFGSTVSGRPADLAGIEDMVGMFINTIPVCMDFSERMPLKQFSSKHHVDNISRNEYSYLSLSEIQAISEVPSGKQLFDSIMIFENVPAGDLSHATDSSSVGNNRQVEVVDTGSEDHTNYALTLSVSFQKQLTIILAYKTNKYTRTSISRFLKHFEKILTSILLLSSDQDIQNIQLLSSDEISELIAYPTKKLRQKYSLIHKQFSQLAKQYPYHSAVEFESAKSDYQTLNQQSDRIAGYLLEQGYTPGNIIGFCLPRSIEMIATMLGILKAGSAYLPLDPEYPKSRLEYIINDSGVKAIIIQSQNSLELNCDVKQLHLNSINFSKANEDFLKNRPISLDGDAAACVIYTSGSTGQPKGVILSHHNIYSYYLTASKSYNVSRSDRILQFSSISFDIYLEESMMALLTGATLVLRNNNIMEGGQTFWSFIGDRNITTLSLPTAFWHSFVNQLNDLQSFIQPGLNTIILGGEALSSSSLQKWQAHCESFSSLSQIRIFNTYGPTETTVIATIYDVSKHKSGKIPIGKPIGNTSCFILDEYLNPVPIGVIGELYIAGDGLARGYLNDKELTASRFLEPVITEHGNIRVYKSGDRVRLLENGLLNFIGRIDNQVKIRGYRVELDEIENQLQQHSQVQDVVVLYAANSEVDPEHKSLFAYIVPSINPSVNELTAFESVPLNKKLLAELKQQLVAALPDYMIPNRFIGVSSIPLTKNGKIDKKRLRTTIDHQTEISEFTPARTPVEKTLLEIWQSVLKNNKIGINDNFFMLGGDSIISIQIVSRAKAKGINFSVKHLFQHQTIEQLAQFSLHHKVIEAPQFEVIGIINLLPIQQQFFTAGYEQPHHYHQSLLLTVPEAFNRKYLSAIIQALFQRHDMLRVYFTCNEKGIRLGHHRKYDNGILIDSQMNVDITSLSNEQTAALIEQTGTVLKSGMELNTGPLFKTAYFETTGKDKSAERLLLTAHHLVVDAVSWRILLTDIKLAFSQLIQGKLIQLPDKTSSYQQWSVALYQYARSEAIKEQREYWLDLLSKPVKALPGVDSSAKPIIATKSQQILKFSTEQTELLLTTCHQAYRTQINELLLSALLMAYNQWTGQAVMRLKMEGHGREALFDQLDITETIGWFTSMYPLILINPDDSHSTGDIIKSVKEQYRNLPNNGIDYGVLTELSEDEEIIRLQGEVNEFQTDILFNYLGQFDAGFDKSEEGFTMAPEVSGPDEPLVQKIQEVLAINSAVSGNELAFSFTFSEDIITAVHIEALIECLRNSIEKIIEHCIGLLPKQQQENTKYLTPSDFPFAHLKQYQLDQLEINHHNIESIYIATPMQQGMLFHSLVDENSGLYTTQTYFDFNGELNISAFYKAWNYTINRHAVFRTSFYGMETEQIHQIVSKQVHLPVIYQDYSSIISYCSDKNKMTKQLLENLRSKDKQEVFNFEKAPLMRVYIIRLVDDLHHILWSLHHSLLDGWCMPLVFAEIVSCYQAFNRNQNPQLPAVASYENYIGWLFRQDRTVARDFWRKQLSGLTEPSLLLAPAINSDTHGSEHSAHCEFSLQFNSEISHSLVQVARENKCTLNVILQLAWGYLLHRYSGHQEVLFGYTVSGRPAMITDIEQMIGLFINSLPIRINFDKELEITQCLSTIQEDNISRDEYGYLSLTEIQAVSELPPGIGLFDSLLVFENYPTSYEEVESENNTTGAFSISNTGSKEQTNYALTLVAAFQEKLSITLHYSSLQYSQNIIARIVSNLEKILISISEKSSNCPVNDIMYLSSTEVQKLLQWSTSQENTTATPVQHDQSHDCIHHLIEQQAEKHPRLPAVVFEDLQGNEYSLSYEELNAQANSLAHYLLSQRVLPDLPVAVCIERSAEMVVAIIGILKAGAAYLPLDTKHPQARLESILNDAGIEIIVSSMAMENHYDLTGYQTICLDNVSVQTLLADSPNTNPQISIPNNHLAYVIYTSGSTGQPKGVMIEHRQLLMSTLARVNHYQSQPQSFLLFSTFAFDSSIAGLFWTLIQGGKLCLFDLELLADSDYISAFLVKHRISHFLTLPSVYRSLLNGGLELGETLSTVIVAGEVCDPDLVKQHYDYNVHSTCYLYNEYGPTEASVWSSVHCCAIDPIIYQQSSVPIGISPGHVNLWILNDLFCPVPIAAIGELYIGGKGLSRGYLNNSEMTAESFVTLNEQPFIGEQNVTTRFYKTGDLTRWSDQGELLYVGRADEQLKIRGFRIEPGEIENQLKSMTEIDDAVVMLYSHSPQYEDKHTNSGNGALTAYLSSQTKANEQEDKITEIKLLLSSKLPHYMVPTYFVFMKAFPLLPNGKLDRNSLPTPVIQDKLKYVEPSNNTETILRNIWQDVLKREQIGIHDNFFELGGDSIISIQVVSRAKKQGLNFSVKKLFEKPTIAELAPLIAEKSDIVVEQHPVSGELELTPIQKEFFQLNIPERHHYNQSVLLTTPPEFNEQKLQLIIKALYQRHDNLRLRFKQSESGEWQGLYQPIVDDSWQKILSDTIGVISLKRHEKQTIIDSLEQHCNRVQASLDLQQGPLFKAILFTSDDSDEKYERLFFVIHHLIVDGVSWRILLSDLSLACQQLNIGQEIELPVKTSSFLQWSSNLKDYAVSKQLQEENCYWQQQLEKVMLSLPGCSSHGDEVSEHMDQSYTSANQAFSLSAENTEYLIAKCPKVYHTRINELLLSALLMSFCHWSGQSSLRIKMEGHGREELFDNIDITETIGWFTCHYPLLLDLTGLSDNLSIGTVIKTVKEQYRAIPNNGIGYGLLTQLKQDKELLALAKSSQFGTQDIVFNYLGQFDNNADPESMLFTATGESTGNEYSPLQINPDLITINAIVNAGQLHFSLSYIEEFISSHSVDTFSNIFNKKLVELIKHCQDITQHPERMKRVKTFTPSDFPYADFKQDEIDHLPVPHYDIEKLYIATPMQKGMLFHSLADQVGSSYTIQIFLDLRGGLDYTAFCLAWQAIIKRHDIFRTIFVGFGSENIHQLVKTDVSLPITLEDWRSHDIESLSDALSTVRRKEKEKGFDFKQAPLMRIRLMRLKDNLYHMIWSHHHVLLDGWCTPVLFDEVMRCYGYFSQKNNDTIDLVSDLLPAVTSYENYIAWLYNQDENKAKEFWQQHLSGFSTPTQISVNIQPSIRNNSQILDDFRQLTAVLDEDISAGLEMLAKSNQCTVFVIAQMAWSYLLHRYSGDSEVLFGSTVSGRPASLSDIERMIGLFINSIPIRAVIDNNESVASCLSRLHQNNIECDEYSYISLTDIQQVSDIPNNAALFDSIIIFENYPVGDLITENQNKTTSTLLAEDVISDEQTNYGLTLSIDYEKSLKITLGYNLAIYETELTQKILDHLVQIFNKLYLLGSDGKISELDILTADEKQKLIWQLNDTQSDFPESTCIQELFEQQVRQHPSKLAVYSESDELSYGELNRYANQIAHYLLQQGVKPDTVVGLCVERGPDMIIGILGILKSGCAYLPIDTAYPEDRIEYMLSNSGIEFILSQQALMQNLPLDGLNVLPIDESIRHGLLSKFNDQNIDKNSISLTSNNLVYIIYTSGSTGVPKGVMIEHFGLVNIILSDIKKFGITHSDKVIHCVSIAFDAATEILFDTLCSGASLYITAPKSDIVAFMQEHQITYGFVPAPLLESFGDAQVESLKVVVIGGDVCSPALVQNWASQCRMFNLYGPTECTITSTVAELQAGLPVTIGRPVNNAQCYILDNNGKLLPPGMIGELYIGGAGLSRGYCDSEQLTNERFGTYSFSSEMEEIRLYKTGDLACWLPDGNLAFHGRLDQQVKIRGYRIETGEIEVALSSLNEINEAIVLAYQSPVAGKQLVAYCVSDEYFSIELDKDDLILEKRNQSKNIQQQLKEKLPEYMVPDVIKWIDNIPLTVNGKIDREALPDPADEDLLIENYVAAESYIEKQLLKLWKTILKIEKIGIHDNFFKIGGHSLLATRFISLVRQELSVELAIRDVFEYATISELAKHIESLPTHISIPEITVIQDRSKLPVSYAQQRLWFIDKLERGSSQYNMTNIIGLSGVFNRSAFIKSLQYLLQRHETLITTFTQEGWEIFQNIRTIYDLPLIELNLQHLSSDDKYRQLHTLASMDAEQNFDLTKDLMLRVHLLGFEAEEHVVLFNIHHIASDGWSMGVLIKEFSILYACFKEEQIPSLPSLDIQYADYASWQRQWLEGGLLKKQLADLKTTLQDLPEVHSLPTDFSRPKERSFRGAKHLQLLAPELTSQLDEMCENHDVTLYILMQSVFALLISRYSNSEDIVIGSSIAGRNHADLENLVGLFVNMLVIRTIIPENTNFTDVLKTNKQVIFDRFAHQHIPFELIVETLKPERNLSHTPLFQILFTFQNNEQITVEEELTDFHMRDIAIESNIARYDLELDVNPSQNGLELSWSYSTDLFKLGTIEQLASSYLLLLTEIIKLPEANISLLPLLDQKQQQLLIHEWGRGVDFVGGNKQAPIQYLFEQQAKNTPDFIAVKFTDQSLNYFQLNKKANQLAHYLLQHGITSGDYVGVYMTRSCELLVAILGVLKAGAAYIPLEPSYSSSRLEHILADTDLDLLLINDNIEDESVSDCQCFLIDHGIYTDDWLSDYDTIDIPSITSAEMETPAYVIYTSGSTGQPKGVVIPHRGLTDYCTFALDNYYENNLSGSLLITSHNFDISIPSLFLPLLAGDYVNILPARHELPELVQLFENQTEENYLLRMTPQHVSGLLTLLDYGFYCEDPHVFVIGGETFNSHICHELQSAFPGAKIYNHYGPTETVVGCALHHVSEPVSNLKSSIPIGRPMHNTRLYVLNKMGLLNPIGVPGELYIEGSGVGLGYLNQVEQTRQVFVNNPLEHSNGAVIYKSGDLVRWKQEGQLEFISRVDHQIKLRGFRVELGEVEFQLSLLPEVKNSCVLLRGEGEYSYLVCYLTLTENYNMDSESDQKKISKKTSQIKRKLSPTLPEYMLPKHYVTLATLPLTSNGKIDHKALPMLDKASLEGSYDAPVNAIERKLVGIWQVLLKLDKIGTNQDFFESGGHSLLLIRLYGFLHKAGWTVAIADLYRHPTIAKLANLIQKKYGSTEKSTEQFSSIVQLNNCQSEIRLFCLPPGGGSFACYQKLAKELNSTARVYGLETIELMANSKISSLEELVDAYIQQIKHVQEEGPYYLAGWSFGARMAYEVALKLIKRGDVIAYLVAIDGDPILPDYLIKGYREKWYSGVQGLYAHAGEFNWSILDDVAKEDRIEALTSFAKQEELIPEGVTGLMLKKYFQYLIDINIYLREYTTSHGCVDMDLLIAVQTYQHEEGDSPTYRWEEVNSGLINKFDLDSGHMDIVHNPMISGISKLLVKRLKGTVGSTILKQSKI